MKTNHFICPTCGHDWYENGAYATCDGCQTFFYVAQSRTCRSLYQQSITHTTPEIGPWRWCWPDGTPIVASKGTSR